MATTLQPLEAGEGTLESPALPSGPGWVRPLCLLHALSCMCACARVCGVWCGCMHVHMCVSVCARVRGVHDVWCGCMHVHVYAC